MRVRVECERYLGPGSADWLSTCDCGESLSMGDWEAGMEWALGHLSFTHPTKPPRPCWEITITDGTHTADVLVLANRT